MMRSFLIAFLVSATSVVHSHRAWQETQGLPCTLWLDTVKTSSGEGIKAIIECSASITNAVLKGPTGKTIGKWGELPKGVFPGPFFSPPRTGEPAETYTLEGEFERETTSVSATVAHLTENSADFPCKLEKEEFEESFTLSVRCSAKVLQTVLRVPLRSDDYPYHPRYLGTIESGTHELMRQRRAPFSGKTFEFQGAYNGKRGSSKITLFPSPMP
mmetsp:Transcript_40289/g.93712  ORF Transcript_40289/g.93712 Transcript_40289/m.93712 type:complete len:215 (+) Transcript_40289:108-752(+)|eukprot:CAMPEP_0171102362 /NCGR_PEP_ID=MMETSP0766_2-20121228/57609_1 /TAXON_ID=439317 /ORGANISM="Gambierdiscus australes, Strain CAWD 149" /LENGTH=214 /DNA_ID=CAMNT_0011562631 /DNA_START=100 /DNA_END=744 /DNA_ORIENTATION=+